jgi:hypothetical protein
VPEKALTFRPLSAKVSSPTTVLRRWRFGSEEKISYQPPVLTVLGAVHELTEGPIQGLIAFPHNKLSGT